MTVRELIQQLNKIAIDKGEHLQITVCDLSDDDEEAFHFNRTDGCEVVESGNHPSKFAFVAIYMRRK